ncbi:uncharacterized protein METZ01_LOCUS214371, partial [marine metagenome]
MDTLCKLTAREAISKLKLGEITPTEMIDAAEKRVLETDRKVNALPTLCFEQARNKANYFLEHPVKDPPPHYLFGLPIAVKDLVEVSGVRTTWGSPIHADHISTHSDYLVERLEANGAITIAKSNTPEFGAGSHTF